MDETNGSEAAQNALRALNNVLERKGKSVEVQTPLRDLAAPKPK